MFVTIKDRGVLTLIMTDVPSIQNTHQKYKNTNWMW